MKYAYQIISALLIIILIIFLFKKCNNTPIKVPVVINPTLVRDTVYQESELSKFKEDSLNKIIAYYKNLNNILDSNLVQSDKDKRTLADTLEATLHPDKGEVTDYIDLSNKRDTICNTIVANQKVELSLKDSILSDKQNLYDSLFKNFNLLASQSLAQSAYEKQLQPKNEFYVGGGLYGNKTSFVQGIDVGIFLKNKKGRVYKVDVMYDFHSGLNYSLSTYFKIHL